MSKTFLVLGLLSAIATAIFAKDCNAPATPSCDGSNECTLTASLNGSGNVVLDGKPPGDRYRAYFGGSITWKFINNTGDEIRVRLGSWDLDSHRECPVKFGTGAVLGKCEGSIPTLKNGETKYIDAEAAAAEDDPNEPFEFRIYIAKKDEVEKPIDPELQIDDNPLNQFIVLILAALSAIFFFASWWTRRRASRKP
jgi:hypothetical protein